MNSVEIISTGIESSAGLNDITKPAMMFAAKNNMLSNKTIRSRLFLNTTQNMVSLDSVKK